MGKRKYVFVYLDDGFVAAGLLEYIFAPRASYAVFRYGDRYLQRPNALAIDPVQLPLQRMEMTTPEGFDMFNGIRDAGPDRWGRYLLEKKLTPPIDELDYITGATANRVGALAFADDLEPPPAASFGAAIWLDLAQGALGVEAALQEQSTRELEALLEYGPSIGGARPKATVSWQGRPYIAKFSVSLDKRNEPLVEYATMSLAKQCGLDVPAIDIARAAGRDVYLIERFDRASPDDGFRPFPFISGLTATGLHESDFQAWSYRGLSDALGRLSEDPEMDRRELFARLVFNILVFNNDDHLRNHGLVRRPGRGWRLSPLYDVVPSTISSETYHLALSIGDFGKAASLENARTAAPFFGLTPADASAIIDRLLTGTRGWKDHFRACGVPAFDIERLRRSFRDQP